VENLPELRLRPDLLDTVRYAAAMWEFQLLHFDHDRARAEGLERSIVQGPLLGTYLARVLAPAGTVEHLEWRNHAVVPVGTDLVCGGTVDRETGAADVWIRDGDGTTVVTGSARVRP
jgi:hydroxyacyl-ACP dehydratase HTD2-like protein with hotdog domain